MNFEAASREAGKGGVFASAKNVGDTITGVVLLDEIHVYEKSFTAKETPRPRFAANMYLVEEGEFRILDLSRAQWRSIAPTLAKSAGKVVTITRVGTGGIGQGPAFGVGSARPLTDDERASMARATPHDLADRLGPGVDAKDAA